MLHRYCCEDKTPRRESGKLPCTQNRSFFISLSHLTDPVFPPSSFVRPLRRRRGRLVVQLLHRKEPPALHLQPEAAAKAAGLEAEEDHASGAASFNRNIRDPHQEVNDVPTFGVTSLPPRPLSLSLRGLPLSIGAKCTRFVPGKCTETVRTMDE